MKEKLNCHICGWAGKVESGTVTDCPVCGASFANTQEETMQNSVGCAYAIKKGAMMKPGKFIMTNKRFLWVKDNGSSDSLLYASSGLLGVLFGRALAKNNELYVNVPLNEIISVERTRKGLEMLIIKDRQGTSYPLRIGDMNEWEEIILNTIESNNCSA